MAISISRSHELGEEEIALRVKKLAAELSEQIGLTSTFVDHRVDFNGLGMGGQLKYDASSVHLNIKVPFFMPERTVRAKIEEYLDKHLA